MILCCCFLLLFAHSFLIHTFKYGLRTRVTFIPRTLTKSVFIFLGRGRVEGGGAGHLSHCATLPTARSLTLDAAVSAFQNGDNGSIIKAIVKCII